MGGGSSGRMSPGVGVGGRGPGPLTVPVTAKPGPNTTNPGGLTPGPGGGRTGAVLISQHIQPGSTNKNAYNHYSLLRSLENVFGLSHLGYANQTGLKAFGRDVYVR